MAPGARAPLALLVALLASLIALAAPARARAADAAGEAPGAAPAAATRARLVYAVDPAAAPCPSEDELRAAIEARVGHPVFGEPATLTIDVSVRRAGKAFVATVALPDVADERGATRELRSDVGCAELATAAALVASIAVDPASVLRPPPSAPVAPPPPASRTWRTLVGLGVRGAWGLTPDPTAGIALSAAAIDGRVAYGASLEGFLSSDERYPPGSVGVRPMSLALFPCLLGTHWEACGVARLGLLRGNGMGFDKDFTVTKAFFGLGARGGTFVDVGRLRLRASFELASALPRTSFVVSAASAYTTPGVSLIAGLDALFSFQ